MSRQRMLRASSSQSLCIFCACRLAAQETPSVGSASSQAQRRHLNSTRAPFQSTGAAAASISSANDAQNGAATQQWTFDPSSPLSATEQRQRAAMFQRRREQAEQQQQQQQQHDQQQRQHAQRQQPKQSQQQQQRAFDRSGARQQTRAPSQRVSQMTFRPNQDRPNDGEKIVHEEAGRMQFRKQNSSIQDSSAFSSKTPRAEQRLSEPKFRGVRSPDHVSTANQTRSERGPQRAADRKVDARQTGRDLRGSNNAPNPAQKDKIAAPSFGMAEEQASENKGSVWGTRRSEIKPLQYGTEDTRPPPLDEGGSRWGAGQSSIKPLQYGTEDTRPTARDKAQDTRSSAESDYLDVFAGMKSAPRPVVQQSRFGSFGRPQPRKEPEDVFAGIDFKGLDETDQSYARQNQGARVSGSEETAGIERSPQKQRMSQYEQQSSFEGAFPVSQPPTYRAPQEQPSLVDQHSKYPGQKQQGQAPRFDAGQHRDVYERYNDPQVWEQSQSSFNPPQRNDVEYRTLPFDPKQYQQQHQAIDTDQPDNWQHLKRRNSEPSPLFSQQQQQAQQPNYYDDEWVDRRFHEHQIQRQQAFGQFNHQPSPVPQTPSDPDAYRRQSSASVKCARCGQMGHSARECEGPRMAPCFRCGEYGHFARDCNADKSTAVARAPFAPFKPNRDAARQSDKNAVTAKEAKEQHEDASDFLFPKELPSKIRKEFLGEQDYQPVHARKESSGEQEYQPANFRREFSREQDEEPQAPEERVLKSKKFSDEPAPKKTKGARRSRKDDDEDMDDFNDERPARRSRRRDDFEDEVGEDYLEGMRDERQARRQAKQSKKQKAAKDAEKKAARAARKSEQAKPVNLPDFVSVSQLAQTLNVRYEPFVERLAELGYDDVFPGKVLNAETSGMIAMEYDFEPVFESGDQEAEERDLVARPEIEDKTFLPTRPPVVTIMGHVDHGKTTILDYLRKSSVAAGEAGGITQHIGAFSVPLAASGKTITFLDTPGHAAFLAMRQRGANVTDIVILVVAADDSVKPQTIEAIKHAKSAGVPMIVAVNKVDKEESDIQRVKQDLARHGVEIEDFGGDTQVVCVSGKTGQGMDELEEAAVTLSEILDHRAEIDGAVEGWVLEATTKKAGRVATVLVNRGTLKAGSIIVAGKTWARVRSLRNEAGQTIAEVSPGMPAEVDGWRDQPAAGDRVLQAPNEQKANSAVEYRLEIEERSKTAIDMEAINESRRIEQVKREAQKAAEEAAKIAAKNAASGDSATDSAEAEAQQAAAPEPAKEPAGPIQIPFIIKADVSGSAEAVTAYISSISSAFVLPLILSSTVGAVHESDIEHAAIAGGHVIAFNLPANPEMNALAESRGVQVLENNIIYRVLDDVKAVLETKMPDIVTQRVLGEAEVGQSFEIGVGGRKKMVIAGCKVRNGAIGRGARARVTRKGEKVYDGTISSLKNVKKDVTEMRKGTECGMGFDGWEGFEVGDQIQTYEEVREKRKL